MYQYIMEPKPVRPWLKLRMPTFGFTQDEGRQVVEGFAAVAGVNNPHTYVAAASIDQEHYDRGFRRFRFYKCLQCHPSSIDQGLPEGLDPDDLSINLMLSKTRLRPEWIADFMARPKQIAGTQTRMPTVFYSVEGAPKVDKPDADIADIVTYLMGMKEDAEITMKAYEAEQKAEEKKQDVDWSKMSY
jgi:mono/diheme cytochrome c family protein